jgi:biotin carboxyl carrier protein
MTREKKLRRLSDGKVHSVSVDPVPTGYRVSATSPEIHATVARSAGAGPWSVVTESGLALEASVERRDGEIHVEVEGRRFVFVTEGAGGVVAREAGREGRVEVKAPMPGKVVKLLVAEGERVRAGQPVLLFEAMKMQNELRSPQDGVVVVMDVQAGQAVESRERLYVVEQT